MIFLTIPEQDFAPGRYEWEVPLTPDVSMVKVTLDRLDWPGVRADDVARAGVVYSDGTARVSNLPGGVVLAKDGQPVPQSMIGLGVIEEKDPDDPDPMASRRRAVESATVVLEVIQSLRTSVVIHKIED